ncbi:MAG: hypothetical protein P8X86_08290 [Desulfofustis sp.]|jgi:hypothetical protein
MKIAKEGQNQFQIANRIDPLRHHPAPTIQPADYRQFFVQTQPCLMISDQVEKGTQQTVDAQEQ